VNTTVFDGGNVHSILGRGAFDENQTCKRSAGGAEYARATREHARASSPA
jgi:hypothetical protein